MSCSPPIGQDGRKSRKLYAVPNKRTKSQFSKWCTDAQYRNLPLFLYLPPICLPLIFLSLSVSLFLSLSFSVSFSVSLLTVYFSLYMSQCLFLSVSASLSLSHFTRCRPHTLSFLMYRLISCCRACRPCSPAP